MDTCLLILRFPLDSWCRNKSESGLGSWFWVSVGSAHKTRQTLTVNFAVCFEKCNFFTNGTKHRQIIYRWKAFFVTSMNLGSLPQNKALFGSDLFAKFLFARKYVPMIRALSSGNEDTILKRSSRWIRCHLVSLSKTAKGGRFTAMKTPRLTSA